MRFLLSVFIVMLSVTMVFGGTITGKVTSKDSGEPLAGVYLHGAQLGGRTTDSSGSYRFDSVSGGTEYTLTPTLFGYNFDPISASGTVTADTTENFSAALNA